MSIEDIQVHPIGARLDDEARSVLSGAAGRRRTAVIGAVALALVVAVVARFVTVSHLWLDEALTVNIARLPFADIPEALRHDGAPPLYYLLLHVWMDMAGTGDVAARALSGLFSVASLPLMWLAGRRLAAERSPATAHWVAWAATLLLASSPFAVRYATEVRMYSLVVLLVLTGFLALDAVLRRTAAGLPTGRASVGLGAVTGLLLLTHYWAFFLVGAVAVLLLVRWRQAGAGVGVGDGEVNGAADGAGEDGAAGGGDGDPSARAGARRALLAMAGGSLLFLPWLPSFVEQMGSTGTPWGLPPKPRAVFDIILQFAGGLSDTSLPLGLLLYSLIALGLFGMAVGAAIVTLDLRGRPPGRMVAAGVGLTMAFAIVVGQLTGSAFAIRYAAVVLPLVLLLAALGTATLAGTWAGPTVLTLAVVLGFVTAIPSMAGDRTAAGRVATALRAQAQPGDVVAYCPDQLGPSVSRVLGDKAEGLVQVTFPRGTSPEFVDWVGYQAASRATAVGPFAAMLLERAGPDHAVWVVWAPGYRTFGTKCQALLTALRGARPLEQRVVTVSTSTLERPGLVLYPPN